MPAEGPASPRLGAEHHPNRAMRNDAGSPFVVKRGPPEDQHEKPEVFSLNRIGPVVRIGGGSSGTAGAIQVFPGNQGNFQVTFNGHWKAGVQHRTGGHRGRCLPNGHWLPGTGPGNSGDKVFLHSSELDGQPVTSLTSMSTQSSIDPTSLVQVTPYFNLRVQGSFGTRTLTTTSTLGVPTGRFATTTAPTGATAGWTVTGDPMRHLPPCPFRTLFRLNFLTPTVPAQS